MIDIEEIFERMFYNPRNDCMDCPHFLYIPNYHNYCRKRKELLMSLGDDIIYLICTRKYEGEK